VPPAPGWPDTRTPPLLSPSSSSSWPENRSNIDDDDEDGEDDEEEEDVNEAGTETAGADADAEEISET